MKNKKIQKINKNTQELIIERWQSSRLNSIPAIALEFGLKQHVIKATVNNYLSTQITT
ncbi:hypothetical protein [Flavobacterium piscisymbiosum]|uniref:Uncharacterized protein n=1 Tax=Flavobacterium piscisymbiosum TaxID=2893753 RepID=A0ABS8MLE2_9FLAO|nr:hypothetical protein [Flavobacterium sp. F-30]MCC9066310.1 hypothetical protein [Flavobacterium sp. F-30]